MNRVIGAAIVLAAAVSVTACGAAGVSTGAKVSVAAFACPATVHQPTNPRSATLVPGTPTGATACRYAGLGEPHSGGLARSASLTTAQTTALAAALNAGKQAANGVYNCPNDTGGVDVVGFDYADAAPVEIVVHTSGCRLASDGNRNVDAAQAVQQLAAIVGQAVS